MIEISEKKERIKDIVENRIKEFFGDNNSPIEIKENINDFFKGLFLEYTGIDVKSGTYNTDLMVEDDPQDIMNMMNNLQESIFYFKESLKKFLRKEGFFCLDISFLEIENLGEILNNKKIIKIETPPDDKILFIFPKGSSSYMINTEDEWKKIIVETPKREIVIFKKSADEPIVFFK